MEHKCLQVDGLNNELSSIIALNPSGHSPFCSYNDAGRPAYGH